MSIRNPFEAEWRDCLRAHYLHVVRSGDTPTEQTLVHVMQQAGFSDADLVELRIRATIRTEDMEDGFVPDFAVLEEQIAQQKEVILQQPVESVVSKPTAVTSVDLSSEDTIVEAEAEPEVPPPSDEYYAPPDETPRQLSLF
ncbi:MAG: hypothetical protein SF123_08460 [Chloroflexota bacterium]|nr:hypothetical protein [Chloroflexota bacterium]